MTATRHPLRFAVLLAFLAGVPAAWTAAWAADAENGHRIADRWCSSCHVVSGRGADGGSGGTDAAPTLAGIARDPQRGPDWFRRWLSAPHPPMPDPNLARTEIDDVVAYLQSLSR